MYLVAGSEPRDRAFRPSPLTTDACAAIDTHQGSLSAANFITSRRLFPPKIRLESMSALKAWDARLVMGTLVPGAAIPECRRKERVLTPTTGTLRLVSQTYGSQQGLPS